MTEHWPTIPGARGCGSRQQKALYMCVGLSPFGVEIEEFILDPVHPYSGDPFRAPILVEHEDKPNDVLIWIGKEFYPYVPDFIEEAKKLGVSRRIPHNFSASQLSKGSRMILIHARAIPAWGYLVDTPSEWCKLPNEDHECTFNLWPLSLLDDCKGHELMKDGSIRTPSCQYMVKRRVVTHAGPGAYGYGAFAAFHITHYEWVDKDGGCPEGVAAEINQSDLDLEVVAE